jgi:phage gp46-like protein
MSDLKLAWNNELAEADLVLDGPELAIEQGLDTAIIISLFTDARASADDELPGGPGSDPRGFWADSVAPVVAGDVTGSRLWLLERAKRTPDTLRKVEAYASDALRWLLDDGHADQVACSAEAFGDSGISLAVRVTVDGRDQAYSYLLNGGA